MKFLLLALFPFIGELLAKYLNFIVVKLTWKVLVYGIWVISIIVLISSFYLALKLLLDSVAIALPTNVTSIFISFLPTNTPLFISSALSMELAFVIFNYKKRALAYRTVENPTS